MWTATDFSGARRRTQEKVSNMKFVEKCVRLHLSHRIACAGKSAFSQEQYLSCVPFLFIYFTIKVEGSATANPALGQPVWTTSVVFRWPGLHFLEEYI